MKTKLKTIQIKGKEYVMVHERIRAFNESFPNGSIQTEISFDGDKVRARAIVTPDVTNPVRIFTGHVEEDRGSSMINKTSAVANAETGAIGRALGAMGIGILDGIASADEVVSAITSQQTYQKAPSAYRAKGPVYYDSSKPKPVEPDTADGQPF